MSSKKKSEISHRGRVIEITPLVTKVEIISESACSSCHAKGLCSLGDSKSKIVEVTTRGWDNLSVGQEVEVTLKASMGHKAVWIAYAAPLVVMVLALLISLELGVSELISGLIAIACIAVYYFVIWLFRGKLKNEYIFNLKY